MCTAFLQHNQTKLRTHTNKAEERLEERARGASKERRAERLKRTLMHRLREEMTYYAVSCDRPIHPGHGGDYVRFRATHLGCCVAAALCHRTPSGPRKNQDALQRFLGAVCRRCWYAQERKDVELEVHVVMQQRVSLVPDASPSFRAGRFASCRP